MPKYLYVQKNGIFDKYELRFEYTKLDEDIFKGGLHLNLNQQGCETVKRKN